MTLLDTLAGELLGPKSVGELSKTGGASSQQTKQLVTAALPLLLSGMHQNAGTAAGADSLSKALARHASDAQSSTSAMLKQADAADGKKILTHILGDNEKTVTAALSRTTGLSKTQVSSMLGQLAPVVLSLVGSFQQQSASQTQTSGLAALLGSALLGSGYQQSNQTQQSGLDVASLAGALLGGSTGSGAGASLLTGLLGGGTQTTAAKPKKQSSSAKPKKQSTSAKPKKTSSTAAKPKEEQQSGGVDLSGLLMGLLK